MSRSNSRIRKRVDYVSVHEFGFWEDRWPEGYYERLLIPPIGRHHMKVVGRRASGSPTTLQILPSGHVKVFPHQPEWK